MRYRYRYRFFALIILAIVMVTSLHAASFDCFRAKLALDRAICDDAELSALDEEMAVAYNAALERQSGYPERLIAEQAAWLKTVHKYQNSDPVGLRSARLDFYRNRIKVLQDFPVFPVADAPTDGPTHTVDSIHPVFDFTLRMLSCNANTETERDPAKPDPCSGPGQIIVHKKGSADILQTLNLPSVTDRNSEGAVTLNASRDYNFDGHPDLVLQTGENGPYNQPTFDVYLFDPEAERFVYSQDFSALSIQGTVKIDQRHCRITAKAEAGPGIFTAFLWKVSGNLPVLIKQEVWDTP
jgi:uncharacterized protein